MDELLALSPRQFEETVTDYLRARGFADVERVGGAGDLGVDIRCKDEHGRLVVVQCKRYQPGAKVTGPDIQHFFGMIVHAVAAKGVFVTTSNFTAAARKMASERDIDLVDGAQIGGFYADVLEKKRAAEEERRRREEQTRYEQEQERRRRELEAVASQVSSVVGSPSIDHEREGVPASGSGRIGNHPPAMGVSNEPADHARTKITAPSDGRTSPIPQDTVSVVVLGCLMVWLLIVLVGFALGAGR